MQSRASISVIARGAGFVGIAVLAAALVGGCDLDDRSVDERESEVKRDASDDTREAGDASSADSGRIVPPLRDAAPSTGGSGDDGGEGGTGGRNESGGSGGEGGSGGRQAQGGAAADDDAGLDEGPDPTPPCTAGHALQPDDGWVARASNCAGIQGRVLVEWRNESFIQVTLDTGDICAEGFSAEAEPSPFDTAFTLNLNEDQPSGSTAADYDAVAYGVVGFEFVVQPPSPQEYFGVMSEGVLYCTRITDLGTYRVSLTDLHAECWNGDTGPIPNPRKLRSIGWYSGIAGDDYNGFQFCVSDLTALTSLD